MASITTERELQSTLLRLTVICATSIQSLRDPIPPNIVTDTSDLPESSQLARQIHSDLISLLRLTQKFTTSLALALRQSSKQQRDADQSNTNHDDPESFSPVSGLDAASLQAAKAQLESIASEVVPKMVFLAKKAWKDRSIYTLPRDRTRSDNEERRRLQELAKSMGGHVMSAADLGMPSSHEPPSNAIKLVRPSLGEAFAREVRTAVEDILSHLSELFHSFLDGKTRSALEKASKARDRADGIRPPPSSGGSRQQAQACVGSVAEARKRSLAINNMIWESCEKYSKEKGGLSPDNLQASKKVWRERAEIMRDGLNEMKEACDKEEVGEEGGEDGGFGEEDQNGDLGFDLSAAPSLNKVERQRLSNLASLVKMGNMLHESMIKKVVAGTASSSSEIDIDMVDALAKALEEAQDELVAAALYGEAEAGLEGFDEEEEEQEEQGDDALESAVLRTMEQYVESALDLAEYVTGNKPTSISPEPAREASFEERFERRFSVLSKALASASMATKSDSSAGQARMTTASKPVSAAAVTAPVLGGLQASSTLTFLSELEEIANSLGEGVKTTDRSVAKHLDSIDPLAPLRNEYHLPTMADVMGSNASSDPESETYSSAPCLYMCGNSLGPLAKRSKKLIEEELETWGSKGVLGHFDHPHGRPWVRIDERVSALMADIVGAKPSEVTTMGSLTANLNVMLTTFYRPRVHPEGMVAWREGKKGDASKAKHKIVYEDKAFPSDKYALSSAILLQGYEPESSLVALKPRSGERTLRTEDILDTIERLGQEGETALVLLGGLQYFTGQLFELERIAETTRRHGIVFGVDLAHAFANVPLRLHDWGIDFGVWCTYKYGSSGPGGIAGLFVHQKWSADGEVAPDRPSGWWGHDKETRFSMPAEFKPMAGAAGWQVSNPSMLDITCLQGSLETLAMAPKLVDPSLPAWDEIGSESLKEETERSDFIGQGLIMKALRPKSERLTAYLEHLLVQTDLLPSKLGVKIVTPREKEQRGSQLCIQIPSDLAVGGSGGGGGEGAKEERSQGKPKVGESLPPPVQKGELISRAHQRSERFKGLVSDIRHPDMLRLAPLAQYSTFDEVWRSAMALKESLLEELKS
ncbi:kynureninase [Violaceomyces palustris]|uniref:Kynureninase n=1 Tax=Violaceomyces palustris TaxID=1673888 RepID=A0ACD0NRE8_9BASI|nr:kynureninase [Violaceomyces palustris]